MKEDFNKFFKCLIFKLFTKKDKKAKRSFLERTF